MSSNNLNRWFSRLQGPLQRIYTPWGLQASKRISQLSRLPMHIEAIAIDTIPQTENAATDQRNDNSDVSNSVLNCAVYIPEASDPWILRMDSEWIYLMIDRLLGAAQSDLVQVPREQLPEEMTSLDWRVATYCLEELIHPCMDLWQPFGPVASPRAELRLTDEITNCAYVRVKFRMQYADAQQVETNRISWDGQWLVPESYIRAQFGRLLFQGKDPAKLTAILARSRISRADLAQLEVGDIVSTEQLAGEAVELECNSGVLFQGIPGVYQGSKAVRLIESCPTEQSTLDPQ